ncbi:rac GTPase-activating protein 1-like [Oppia nitens]|uniref:rac GTPase-activating protein 1-like n=1 Tax=Oppia nitens TaxID=1686743 RepID=UPI0023DA07AD|nr:rac GTPase-activating protein 1-like [Oppia nitens]
MSIQSKTNSMDTLDRMGVFHTGAQLSLVAQFDDMCRFSNSLVTIDEQSLIDLIRKCESNRLGWLATQRELNTLRVKSKQLDDENKDLVAKIKSIRFGYGKEVQQREDLIKQRNALRNQLNAIKDFILKDSTPSGHMETREKVLSYLNLNHLETVNEDTERSFDRHDIDDNDDNMMTESPPINRSQRLKRKTNNYDFNDDFERRAPKATFDETGNIDFNTPNVDVIPPRISLNVNRNAIDDNIVSISQSSPQIKSLNSRLTTPQNPINISPVYSTASLTPLDERKHNLHQKKAFKPVYCGPCHEAIGFFGTFLCCEDCRVVCHMKCKNRLPLPCIPFRKPNGKTSQMVLIADFAPQTRPMIPAIVIHLCNEIERRGLNEEGLYRKCGSDRDIRELKEKFMKAKNGIFGMDQYDIHVLCGVVKQFLRDLDEPIVTRILWRDFVRASGQENPDTERQLIMQTIEELPTSNRDSLAFIMIHLMRVANNDGNSMDCRSLSKIFGPTIVGHSTIDPPMTEILAENPKQIKVMEALFRIPDDYWNDILTSVNSWEPNRFGSPDRRTPSNGRLMGTIQRGTLTPLRGPSKGALSLKPLF